MKTYTTKYGSALVAVMFVILGVGGILGTMIWSGMNSAHRARVLSERVKALAIAEAGLNRAYSILATNWAARDNPEMFPDTQYGDGSYSVTIRSITDKLVLIISTGICGRATVDVLADIKNYGSGSQWTEETDPFNYSILAGGGGMDWQGNGDITLMGNAPVHSNGKLFVNGNGNIIGNVSSSVEIRTVGSAQLRGNADAPSFSGKSPGNVTGTATQRQVPPVQIPDIDLTPFYNTALQNGEVYSGNLHYSSSGTIRPNGGVMWVNGSLKVSGQYNIEGCIIATGDIEITGNGDAEKIAKLPLLVSRDGNIKISGSGRYHGLIYAKTGDFTKTGNGDVIGTIICGDKFTKGGGWSLMSYEDVTPTDPSGGALWKDIVGVSAWQK